MTTHTLHPTFGLHAAITRSLPAICGLTAALALPGCFVEGQQPTELLTVRLPLVSNDCTANEEGVFSLEDCGAFIHLKVSLDQECVADLIAAPQNVELELPAHHEGEIHVTAWRIEDGTPKAYAANSAFSLAGSDVDVQIPLEPATIVEQPLALPEGLDAAAVFRLYEVDTLLRLPDFAPQERLSLPSDRLFWLEILDQDGVSIAQSAEFSPSADGSLVWL